MHTGLLGRGLAADAHSCSREPEDQHGAAPQQKPPPWRERTPEADPRGHWQQVNPHESFQGMSAPPKPEEHGPALLVPGVSAAQVSGSPPSARREGRCVAEGGPESPEPCCSCPKDRAPNPVPAPSERTQKLPSPGFCTAGLATCSLPGGPEPKLPQAGRAHGRALSVSPLVTRSATSSESRNPSVRVNEVSVGEGFRLGRRGWGRSCSNPLDIYKGILKPPLIWRNWRKFSSK